MVTKLLHRCGLHLGESEDLLPPSADNLDGYWEHLAFIRLNEAVLQELHGAWDSPPQFTPDDFQRPALIALLSEARALAERFVGRGVWGWKDPRNSLTIPFWQKGLGDLKVVICIRNPLEVVLSLRKRGFPSVSGALDLWATYTRRALEAVPHGDRVLTHYDAYFVRPAIELQRVVEFVGLPVSDLLIRDQAGPTKSLRHGWLRAKHLRDVGVPRHVLDLYESVCAEAGWDEPSVCPGGAARTLPTQPDLAGGHGRDDQPPVAVGQRESSPTGDVDVLRIDLAIESLRSRLDARDEVIVQLRCELDKVRKNCSRLEDLVGDLRGELTRRDEEFFSLLSEVPVSQTSSAASEAFQARVGYRRLILRTRTAVARVTRDDSTVLVISKGDDELLRLGGRKARHFPQTEAGGYAGAYPASGASAVAHLESLRARGADYLVVPETALWWLDHYPEFAVHLRQYRELACDKDVCRIFALSETDPDRGIIARGENLSEVLARCLEQVPDDPAVLDWNSGLDLTQVATRWPVFTPLDAGPALPYLDRSISVVAIPSDPARASEAHRVARAAVVTAVPNGSGPSFRVDWMARPAEAITTVGLIAPSPADRSDADQFWGSFVDGLPGGFAGEIVTEAGGAPGGPGAARVPNLRRADRAAGEREGAFFNRAAAASVADVLVFLAPHLLPLGAIPPICHLFRHDPRIGAIGGKVFAPDGRLEAAGLVVFSDGSVRNFGADDYQVEDPLYEYVRDTAGCSEHVLGTPRELFQELGGFDPTFRTAVYAFTDYCIRARARGRRVCYQPESRFVMCRRPDPGTGAEDAAHDRESFRTKWGSELGSLPRPQIIWDRTTWHSLAVSRP